MIKKRFAEEQIVVIAREVESRKKTIRELCCIHGISEPTFYAWRRKYVSMLEPDAMSACSRLARTNTLSPCRSNDALP